MASAPADSPHNQPQTLLETPWLRRLPLRSLTLLPATHTNTYVLGEGELLIVDPGSAFDDEHARLLSELETLRRAGHRVAGVFLTHHHGDHVAGAAALQQALAVPLYAHPVTAALLREGHRLEVTRLVEDGETLPFGPRGFSAIFTPGHAPGHLCLRDEQSGDVLAGDMVASVGTILVAAEHGGDMRLYLDSLRQLLRLAETRGEAAPLRLWPAHGAAISDGAALLRFYLSHRQAREDKLVAALQARAGTLSELVPQVYKDTPAALHLLAASSLLAHLRKLEQEGRAVEDADQKWNLLSGSAAAAPPKAPPGR